MEHSAIRSNENIRYEILTPKQVERLIKLGIEVLEKDSLKPIDCIISDDTGGRLISIFLYKVISHKHPLTFVSAPGGRDMVMLEEIPEEEEIFNNHYSILVKNLQDFNIKYQQSRKKENPHILVATQFMESGKTIDGIKKYVEKIIGDVDFTVATSSISPFYNNPNKPEIVGEVSQPGVDDPLTLFKGIERSEDGTVIRSSVAVRNEAITSADPINKSYYEGRRDELIERIALSRRDVTTLAQHVYSEWCNKKQ